MNISTTNGGLGNDWWFISAVLDLDVTLCRCNCVTGVVGAAINQPALSMRSVPLARPPSLYTQFIMFQAYLQRMHPTSFAQIMSASSR